MARAFRQQEGGLEAGYVDREGRWIRINPATPTAPPSTAISIRGWTPGAITEIASLLQQQYRLDSKLLAITSIPMVPSAFAIKPSAASTLAMTSNC